MAVECPPTGILANALLPYPMKDTGNLDDVNLVMQPLDDGQVWCAVRIIGQGARSCWLNAGKLLHAANYPSENNALKDIYFHRGLPALLSTDK